MAAEDKKEKAKDSDKAKGDKRVEKTAEAAPEDAAKAAKKKRLIIMIAAGVLVIAGGAAAAIALLGGGGSAHKTPAEADGHETPGHENAAAGDAHGGKDKAKEEPVKGDHAKAGDAKKDAHGKTDEHGKPVEQPKEAKADGEGIDFGQTFALKAFHLNLGNPLENRYVRIEVSFEYKGGETQKGEIEKRMPQLRDAIGNIASRKSREFLLGPDGKDQLRHEILVRVNQFMNRPIESVFITDMLIE